MLFLFRPSSEDLRAAYGLRFSAEVCGNKPEKRKQFSRRLVLLLQKSPKVFGSLREFTGECNLRILYSRSLLTIGLLVITVIITTTKYSYVDYRYHYLLLLLLLSLLSLVVVVVVLRLGPAAPGAGSSSSGPEGPPGGAAPEKEINERPKQRTHICTCVYIYIYICI